MSGDRRQRLSPLARHDRSAIEGRATKAREVIKRLEADGWFRIHLRAAIVNLSTGEKKDASPCLVKAMLMCQPNTEKHLEAGAITGGRLMRYAIVIEKGPKSYGTYVPDLPGCVAVGRSAAEVKKLVADAIPFHLEGLREDGLPIPDPETECEYVEV